MSRAKLRLAFCVLFMSTGTTHLIHPEWYERIVPDILPAHWALVITTGVCEILGGLGGLIPATRRFAAWGLIALLVAVFPANVSMALNAGHFAQLAPAWALWLRLPLQAVLIAGVAHAYLSTKGE